MAANNTVSQSVPHLHFHVVPRRPKDGLRGFFWPRGRYETEAEMAEVAAVLRRALAAAVEGGGARRAAVGLIGGVTAPLTPVGPPSPSPCADPGAARP